MADVKIAYQAAQSLTVTGLSTLANGSNAISDAVDNTTNKFLDYLVEVSATVGTVSGNKRFLVYATSSVDGTNYSDSSDVSNMKLLGIVNAPSNSTAYRSPAFSVASAFGGTIPNHFKIVVRNDSGAAFTAGSAQYRGTYNTVT